MLPPQIQPVKGRAGKQQSRSAALSGPCPHPSPVTGSLDTSGMKRSWMGHVASAAKRQILPVVRFGPFESLCHDREGRQIFRFRQRTTPEQPSIVRPLWMEDDLEELRIPLVQDIEGPLPFGEGESLADERLGLNPALRDQIQDGPILIGDGEGAPDV